MGLMRLADGRCHAWRRGETRTPPHQGAHRARAADAKTKGVKFGRKPKLTPHRMREALKPRDEEGETLRSIGRSYNVSAQTISRLTL